MQRKRCKRYGRPLWNPDIPSETGRHAWNDFTEQKQGCEKMCRCDAQQLTEEAIMELIRQRGNLRFSTLMMFFHLSSTEALAIVENYQAKGILDEKGRYAAGKQGVGSVQEKEKKPQKEIKQQDKTECFRPVDPKIEGQISLFDYMQFHS